MNISKSLVYKTFHNTLLHLIVGVLCNPRVAFAWLADGSAGLRHNGFDPVVCGASDPGLRHCAVAPAHSAAL